MKMILIIGILTLTASSSFARPVMTCTNAGFSDLAFTLTPKGANQMSLEVTASGPRGDYMPRVGERSLLDTDLEASKADYLILRSNENEEQRVFEISIPKADSRKHAFEASVRISKEESDTTLSDYDLICTQ